MITKRDRDLHIPIGLPAAGKTTHTLLDCLVVSKDVIRQATLQYKKTRRDFWLDATSGIEGNINLESVVEHVTKQWFISLLPYGYNIYLDCVNLKTKERKWYMNAALGNRYNVHYIIYQNYEESKTRNRKRQRTVSEQAMNRMKSELENLSTEEFTLSQTIIIVRNENTIIKIK